MQTNIKIDKIKNKISNNEHINIYISKIVSLYHKKIVDIICEDFKHIITNDQTKADVIITSVLDKIALDDSKLNIGISGEKQVMNTKIDIGIVTTKQFIHPINIYFPYVFSSMFERKKYDVNKQIKKKKTKFCAYMYSQDVPYRVKLYNDINKYKKVDALGKSCSNKHITNTDRFIYNENETYNDLAVEKYAEYKFVLAFENGIIDGYVTEKLINPILAGSIPIYAGPSDIFEIFNKDRIIYINDFNTIDDLVKRLSQIDSDDKLYDNIISKPILNKNSYITFDNYTSYLKSQIQDTFNINQLIHEPYYDKINGIDHILWINLDRAYGRCLNMKKQLKNISCKNTKIEAIDGSKLELTKLLKDKNINYTMTSRLITNNSKILNITKKLSSTEIACTLSHIKAINYIRKLEGEYFLICEDDVNFSTCTKIPLDIYNIIKQAPIFDILMLTKTYDKELDQLYTNWNEHHMNKGTIWGAGCYIITKTGVEKICKLIEFDGENIKFNTTNFNVADIFLYEHTDTYVYKYNFINNTADNFSFLHNNHVDMHNRYFNFQNKIIDRDFGS